MTNNRFPKGTLLLFGLFLLTMVATYLITKPSEPPPELQGVLRHNFTQLLPFELTDHNKAVFNNASFEGKWSFVFFGYTSCPDICPTTLSTLNSVHGLLVDATGKPPEKTQTVFVSVDPARDTPEKIAPYVTYFNKAFIGVVAEKAAMENFNRQFGAGYIVEAETAPGEYLVSHTSAIFLVDPYARVVASFSQPHYPTTIVSHYELIKNYFSQ